MKHRKVGDAPEALQHQMPVISARWAVGGGRQHASITLVYLYSCSSYRGSGIRSWVTLHCHIHC